MGKGQGKQLEAAKLTRLGPEGVSKKDFGGLPRKVVPVKRSSIRKSAGTTCLECGQGFRTEVVVRDRDGGCRHMVCVSKELLRAALYMGLRLFPRIKAGKVKTKAT